MTTTTVVGSLAAAYCSFWLISGLAGRRVPDNLMRMIGNDDERFRVMLGAYAVGLMVSAVAIAAGVCSP